MSIIATKKKKIGSTRKELPRKVCPVCKSEKTIAKGFYKSTSPLYAEEGCVPICIDCVKNSVVNDEGTINLKKLKIICRKLDKPLYFDALEAAYAQYRREHSYVSEEEIARQGRDIIALYFKNIASLRQYNWKDYEASERDKHVIQGNSTSKSEKEMLIKKYSGAIESNPNEYIGVNQVNAVSLSVPIDEMEEITYDERWLGKYTKRDIDYLNSYYAGLERDYKIITNSIKNTAL